MSTVERASQSTVLAGVKVAQSRESQGQISLAATLQVRAAGTSLPAVLGLEVLGGRFLNGFDEAEATPAAVVGASVADLFAIEPGVPRVVLLGDEPFAVVGILERTELLAELNDAVFISYPAAARLFGTPPEPGQLYVRAQDNSTEATAAVLPTAITYGGPGSPLIRVPSDLLEARAQVDATFRAVILVLGALSLAVGGLGIANVMTISVLQRAPEIGIRRALGHTPAVIAGQFLLEAGFVGLAGGIAGATAGIAVVAIGATQQGWEFVLEPLPIAGGALLAVLVALLAGIYPALQAARLEPLETLRRQG